MEQIRCPTLIIHGQKDTLIPHSHAKELHLKCTGVSKLIISQEMTHNEYSIY
jgi:pimeloyl-ACP methyl ester carboxylesterase